MKRCILACVLVLLCLIAAGCGMPEEENETKEKVFNIEDFGLTLKTDESFRLSDGGENFDLQITDGNCYISFMVYKKIDLAEEQTPESVYDYHISDMFSRRENVTVISEKSYGVYAGRDVIHSRYSAELNGNKNWYDMYLVDFKGEDTFAWVLVTAMPSHLETYGDDYKNVVLALRKTAIDAE